MTGSVALAFWGEARFTNDVDVIAALDADSTRKFCEKFPLSDYYVSVPAALEAAWTGGQFNIIQASEGVKADIIVTKRGYDGYDALRLRRAVRMQLRGGDAVMVCSPEDLILRKLDFYREGGSEKHLRDIASVLKIGGFKIDHSYIDLWAPQLGVEEQWMAMKRQVGLD